MDAHDDDDWEFVDFERVFTKSPALGGVLENCEIQFRSVPDSPVHGFDNNPALHHPFEFESKTASRNNTAPGTPVLRVPSCDSAKIKADFTHVAASKQDDEQTGDEAFVTAPPTNNAQHDSTPSREDSLREARERAKSLSRTRNASTSSNDYANDEERKHAKLEKNRQSARDCRKRKKEYIGKLEDELQLKIEENEALQYRLREQSKLNAALIAEISTLNPQWGRSDIGKRILEHSHASKDTTPLATQTSATALKRKKKHDTQQKREGVKRARA